MHSIVSNILNVVGCHEKFSFKSMTSVLSSRDWNIYSYVFCLMILNLILMFLFTSIFFLISNIKILLIINKVPNRVHWRCTMGAQIRNRRYNDQEKQEWKNKKNEKRPHANHRECARKKT